MNSIQQAAALEAAELFDVKASKLRHKDVEDVPDEFGREDLDDLAETYENYRDAMVELSKE